MAEQNETEAKAEGVSLSVGSSPTTAAIKSQSHLNKVFIHLAAEPQDTLIRINIAGEPQDTLIRIKIAGEPQDTLIITKTERV